MENEVDVTILPRTEDLVAWLVWLVPVIFLLLWDVWKAWKRRAPWIPGQALVLGALIIQLLFFVDYSRMSGRLMMCVLIAYLLPVLARSGSVTVGSDLTALALSVTFHVVSVVRSVWKVEKRNESLSALAASSEGFDRIISTILILAVIYLLVLLMKAVMSGRTICRIRSQKIASALSCCCTPCDRPSYNDIKDHVLKCWLVARLYQPDYVLVRTGLCSRAFTVVTVCIGVHVIKQTYLQFTDNESLNSVTKRTLVQFVIVGQCVIVLIGWIVLLVRCVTSHMQGIEDAQIHLNAYLPKHIKIRVNPYVKSIAVVDKCRFSKYEETLKMLLIPGESASSLWIANQWGFRKVERCMDQGQEDGKRSPFELICLLMSQTVTTEGEVGISAKEAKAHLQQANKNSWKRTAVSLIHFMIYFYDGSDDSVRIENAMQCYIQGWEYMNFVDGLNEEVKSLGRQADKEFDSLQHSWHKRAQPEMLETKIKQPLRDQLESRSNEERRNLQNFRDSTEVANNCLFETWTVIDPYLSAPQINKIHLLQRVLAKVYFVYMTEDVNKAVLQKCTKLAEEGMEEEISHMALLSAKAQGVLDKVRERNDRVELPHNTDQGSISSPIQTEIEPDGQGNNRGRYNAERRSNNDQIDQV